MASTKGLSKELLMAVGYRSGGESGSVEEHQCGFCHQSRQTAGFTVKEGPNGFAIVPICGNCASQGQIRPLTREYAETLQSREELHRRVFLFAEDVLADAVTETEAPGITSGQTKFSCQFPSCICGVKDVAKDATHQTEQGVRPWLYFMRVWVSKPDGAKEWRAFVSCFTVVRQTNLRTNGAVQFWPLAECALYTDRKQAVRQVRSFQRPPANTDGRVIGHIKPAEVRHVTPSVNQMSQGLARCTFSEAPGNPSFEWPDFVVQSLADESEVWEAITAVSERRRNLIGTHVEVGEDWSRWPELEQKDLKDAVRGCPLHGPEFRALTRLLSSLFDRGKELNPDFGKNKPKMAMGARRRHSSAKPATSPEPVKQKPLCADCGQVRVKRWEHKLCSACTPKSIKPPKQKKGGGEKKNKKNRGKK